MKKLSIKLFSLFIAFTAISCSQDETITSPEAEATAKTGVHKVSIPGPSASNAKVQNYNHVMLSFDDWQEFDATAVTLADRVTAYEDAFFTGTENLSEDDLNAYIDSRGFNEQQPLIDFENSFGFTNSLRVRFNTEQARFLADDVLDESLDPNNKYFFTDEELSLLNDNQEVMIGGVIYRFDSEGYSTYTTAYVETFNSRTAPRSGTCKSYYSSYSYAQYASNKKVKRIDYIRSFPFFYTKSSAKVISYKKVFFGWRLWATKLGVGVQANLYSPSTCSTLQYTGSAAIVRRRAKQLKRTLRTFSHHAAKNNISVIGSFEYSGNSSTYALQW